MHAIGEDDGWAAHAEYDVGVLILSYLQTHPGPADSLVAARLEAVGRDLQALGLDRLQALGQTHLRVL